MADDALTRKEAEMRWYLGSMNDGLFIINTPPRPSTDDQFHDRKDGPTLVLNVTDLPIGKAQAVIAAHNLALRALPLESVREEALKETISIAYGEHAHEFFHDGLSADLHDICKDKAEAYAMGYREACLEIGEKLRALQHAPARVAEGEKVDVLGEQPTHFEMARTKMLRKRIADIVATHDAFVAKATKERAEALRHAIDKARGIGLTKAEQEKQEDYDCPHAYPHRYCETCKVDHCPIGLGKTTKEKS